LRDCGHISTKSNKMLAVERQQDIGLHLQRCLRNQGIVDRTANQTKLLEPSQNGKVIMFIQSNRRKLLCQRGQHHVGHLGWHSELWMSGDNGITFGQRVRAHQTLHLTFMDLLDPRHDSSVKFMLSQQGRDQAIGVEQNLQGWLTVRRRSSRTSSIAWLMSVDASPIQTRSPSLDSSPLNAMAGSRMTRPFSTRACTASPSLRCRAS
jgi:hypothetical protein